MGCAITFDGRRLVDRDYEELRTYLTSLTVKIVVDDGQGNEVESDLPPFEWKGNSVYANDFINDCSLCQRVVRLLEDRFSWFRQVEAKSETKGIVRCHFFCYDNDFEYVFRD